MLILIILAIMATDVKQSLSNAISSILESNEKEILQCHKSKRKQIAYTASSLSGTKPFKMKKLLSDRMNINNEDKETERQLKQIATKGVVMLFNALSKKTI